MAEHLVEDSLKEAQGLLRAGDTEGASAVLQTALSRAPEHARAAHFLGIVRAVAGDLPGALVNLVRALQTDPRNPEILHDLGNVWYEGRNFEEARQCYRDAVALRPAHPQYLAGLARAELGLENLDEAARLVRQALAAAPDDLDLVRFLAEILLASGRPSESVPLWERVVQCQPSDAMAREWLETARQEAASDQGGQEAVLPTGASVGSSLPDAPGASPEPPSEPRLCTRCGTGNDARNRVCAKCGARMAISSFEDESPSNLLLAGDGALQVSPSMAETSVEDAIRTLSSDVLEGKMEVEEYLALIDRLEESIAQLYESSQESLLRDLRASFMARGRALGRDAEWLTTQEDTILAAHEEAYRLFLEAWACLRRLVESGDVQEIDTAVCQAREAMGHMASLDAVGALL